jgi:hypothetical protein
VSIILFNVRNYGPPTVAAVPIPPIPVRTADMFPTSSPLANPAAGVWQKKNNRGEKCVQNAYTKENNSHKLTLLGHAAAMTVFLIANGHMS